MNNYKKVYFFYEFLSFDMNALCICSSRVFLLGPSHHYYTPKCALSRATVYKTPIGDLPIDTEGTQELISACIFISFFFDSYAFAPSLFIAAKNYLIIENVLEGNKCNELVLSVLLFDCLSQLNKT